MTWFCLIFDKMNNISKYTCPENSPLSFNICFSITGTNFKQPSRDLSLSWKLFLFVLNRLKCFLKLEAQIRRMNVFCWKCYQVDYQLFNLCVQMCVRLRMCVVNMCVFWCVWESMCVCISLFSVFFYVCVFVPVCVSLFLYLQSKMTQVRSKDNSDKNRIFAFDSNNIGTLS